MVTHRAPLPHHSELLRDFELESVSVGPAARMIRLEVDPQGGLFYQFAHHRAQMLQLPRSFGGRKLAVLDMVNTAALLDPETQQAVALVAFVHEGTRIILMGKQWGQWFDENLTLRQEHDMLLTIRGWHTPFFVFEKKKQLGFDLLINIYNHDIFRRSITTTFKEGKVNHSLQLLFGYPTGKFQMARLMIHDSQNGKMLNIFDLEEFPLIWPPETASHGPVLPRPGAHPDSASARMTPSPGDGAPHRPHAAAGSARHERPAGAPRPRTESRDETPRPGARQPHLFDMETQPDSIPDPIPELKPRYGPRAGSRRTDLQPDWPPRHTASNEPAVPPPLPSTENLPVPQMLDIVGRESDAERRWRLIEANLMLGRAERTYPLILNHTDLIAERTLGWAPVRLRAAFGPQPAAMIAVIMARWHVNQVLAVADGHAEAERLTAILREREIDRLLKLDTSVEPTSAEQARAILRIDRNADAAAIKKVWRLMLGFINADFGRREEKPIHRKKDEVAKLLQIARNILVRYG